MFERIACSFFDHDGPLSDEDNFRILGRGIDVSASMKTQILTNLVDATLFGQQINECRVDIFHVFGHYLVHTCSLEEACPRKEYLRGRD